MARKGKVDKGIKAKKAMKAMKAKTAKPKDASKTKKAMRAMKAGGDGPEKYSFTYPELAEYLTHEIRSFFSKDEATAAYEGDVLADRIFFRLRNPELYDL